MEEIKFSNGKTEISFFRTNMKNTTVHDFISYSVPRQGEFVSVRGGFDSHIEGRVKSVRWYYSDANIGPVILIHVNED